MKRIRYKKTDKEKKIKFEKNDNVEIITLKINKVLEDLIIKNPAGWKTSADIDGFYFNAE